MVTIGERRYYDRGLPAISMVPQSHPTRMISLCDYPLPDKYGLPLCEGHGWQLELKVVVVYDKAVTELAPPDHCWVCKE
jgi:hypothetical protein